MPAIMWFRRDLRLRDNPALNAALDASSEGVIPLFVLDPKLWEASGTARQAYLLASLESLNTSLGGLLHVRRGDPQAVIPELAKSLGAPSVHIAEDFGPYGRVRDVNVEARLGATALVRTGSSYAVSPGRVTKADGSPYRVFTPFHRAWLEHGWRGPAHANGSHFISAGDGDPLPARPILREGLTLPPAGEPAAWDQWHRFREHHLSGYASQRDRADLSASSAMSQYLRWGEIHPRSMLSQLGDGDATFRKELCWREFYADVLLHSPASAHESLDSRFDAMPWAHGPDADLAFERWSLGMTGYPFVDAGMRQLRAEAWMHNRVRMVAASFLVKDLHLPWQLGAGWFMKELRDADLASNAHGWQWVAGCGTDAAPFYRVFNPVLQGLKFDPDGDYVRRYVPELAHLSGPAAHEPWKFNDGYAAGYPARCVDHAAERLVALEDYATIRQPTSH
ncbi:MAG: deoxyribodipyrimidine photo-lyase [Actinomycetota bacterium]|nr:deoxyribodipyrimidine photo-lyase [Actinomycetota bacterium]MDP2287059.1 deoxyribodipyrimidine photo-lyase [Actinomycetota bacterium]